MTTFYDNTTVSTHRDCARRMYYRHVKHWRGEGMAIPPGFGICFHNAMDVVWAELSKDSEQPLSTITRKAIMEFERSWYEENLPDQDVLQANFPKRKYDLYNIGNAAEIIHAYVLQRADWIRDHKVLAIEKPFVVPLYHDRTDVMYCGRLDKIIEDRHGGVWILDHKTTSSYSTTQGFQDNFLESFSPDSQIDGYAYAGIMEYGDNFKGCYIDGILVHKKERYFCLLPVDRDIAHLDNWLHDTREEIRRIEAQKEALSGVLPGAPFLPVFPKNTHRCYDFNSPCPYTDLCKCLPNPHFEPTPLAFIVDEWSPFDKNDIAQIMGKEEKD